MTLSVPLVLASRSPRRRRLLGALGIPFSVEGSPAQERAPEGASPEEAARAIAVQKARPVAAAHPEALVLAADTVVDLDGERLEKPTDPDDARRMLRAMSGRAHHVCTGVALILSGREREIVFSNATRVEFADLSDDEIDAYVATGAPMDKAGAYGIQGGWGSLFVERIEGDQPTVVGLPLRRLYEVLRSDFRDLFAVS